MVKRRARVATVALGAGVAVTQAAGATVALGAGVAVALGVAAAVAGLEQRRLRGHLRGRGDALGLGCGDAGVGEGDLLFGGEAE